jgi:hypothetical protein
LDGDDAQLLAFVVDDEDFADANPFVDAEVFSYRLAFLANSGRWADRTLL